MTMTQTARHRARRGSAPAAILLAGGGSGGHVAPGLAVAERLRERAPSLEILFLCSQRAIDARMIEQADIPFLPLPAQPLHLHPLAACRFLTGFRRSAGICRRLIRDRCFDRVLTLGGFVAAPVAMAARNCGAPVTLLNLDDPPGKANRWMAKCCDEVLSAVELKEFPDFASRVTGLPIRRCALAPALPEECRDLLGLDRRKGTLLVTGASQGATSINALLHQLACSNAGVFEGWQILHLCGSGADDRLRQAYHRARIPAVVIPFLDQMGLAWGAADLALSRAGANSVAEAAANAVPCIFLPYPHHRDQHQRNNARPLEEIGGAMIFDDQIDADRNSAALAPTLRSLMTDPARIEQMRASLSGHRSPDAAEIVARVLLGEPMDEGGEGSNRVVCAGEAARAGQGDSSAAVYRS